MAPRRALAALVAVGACVAALSACGSTVHGQGSGPVEVSRSVASATAASTTPGSSAASSASVSTGSAQSSPSSGSPSSAALAVAAPRQCPGGSCPIIGTADLGDGFVASLRSGTASDGPAFGASVLELTEAGVPVDWHATDDRQPGQLSCIGGAVANCVVIDYQGAHSASATVWRLGRDSATLAKMASADADTPSMSARDLNGDGFVDVIGLQNDYQPDYVTGQVQWQTWVFDGKNLSSTGCTALAPTPPPRPSAPATGTCAGG